MSTKQLIRDIATLRGLTLSDRDVNDINSKLACAYLDGLLDEQAQTKSDKPAAKIETTSSKHEGDKV